MFETESQSYYEILDVKPDASQSEIRQAYLRTKSAYSKDSAALYSIFDEHETRRVLESIEQAYLVLSNAEKRKEYDRVHGFLKSDERLPLTTKKSGNAHAFSFSGNASAGDAAHEAARAVFGAGASDFGSTRDASGSTATRPAATAGAEDAALAAKRAALHEDYSTPRTLASSEAAGPPVEDYSTRSIGNSQNRLGIVRRIELTKPYEKNSVMEGEILNETSFRGEFLRRVREYKGISIDEIAEFTKISKTYVNCIESEEFESLPAPAYLRGFVAQIAKALKLPHEKAASAYMDNYKKNVLK